MKAVQCISHVLANTYTIRTRGATVPQALTRQCELAHEARCEEEMEERVALLDNQVRELRKISMRPETALLVLFEPSWKRLISELAVSPTVRGWRHGGCVGCCTTNCQDTIDFM